MNEQNVSVFVFSTITLTILFSSLIRNTEYDINLAKLDTDRLMIATIPGSQGMTDLLQQILGENI